MSIKLFAVDWNGTALNDIQAWHEGAKAALNPFGRTITLDELRAAFAVPMKHTYFNLGITSEELAAHGAESQAAFHRVYRENADTITLREGTLEMLVTPEISQLDRIVVSNHDQESLDDEIIRFGLSGAFAWVSGRETRPEIVEKTSKLDRLIAYIGEKGYQGSEVAIVGDTAEEIEIAKIIDGHCISITGGCATEEKLRAAGAQNLIHGWDELPGVIRRLG